MDEFLISVLFFPSCQLTEQKHTLGIRLRQNRDTPMR